MASPTPVRVARRAVILYTLMMRFTVETNPNHPRAKEWLETLSQWLDRLDVRSEVEPWDAEVVATRLGQLDQAQQTDARWSGEATGVLGWALRRVAAPADFEPVDPNQVFPALGFHPATMARGAEELLAGAALQSKDELLAYYAHVRIVQWALQSRGAIAGYAALLQQVLRRELADRGLDFGEAEFAAARQAVAGLSDERCRSLLGNYVVRAHASEWLVGGRERYWETAEPGNAAVD
jgi:hypothetical protein